MGLLAVMKWGQIAANRRGIPGYPQGTLDTGSSDAIVKPTNPIA